MAHITEETINIAGMALTYSLSSNLAEIENAIYLKTGCKVDLNNITWEANANLAESAKDLMNKHRAEYSMTVYLDGYLDVKKYKHVILNKRAGDTWFLANFAEINGSLFEVGLSGLDLAIEDCAEAFCYLGHNYFNRFQYDLAIENFEKALSLDPDNAFAKYMLADLHDPNGT